MKTVIQKFFIAAISLSIPALANATSPTTETYPVSVCPSTGWTHAQLDALPDQILAISRTIQQNYATKQHGYPKEIDIHPLLDAHLLSQSCGSVKTSKARLQITGDKQSETDKNLYKAFMIKAHNMSEKSCHTLIMNKKMKGLLGYFSEISVNNQPIVLGSDDSFYECNRFGKNDFIFVSRF